MTTTTTTLNPGTGGDKVLVDSALGTVDGVTAPTGAVAQMVEVVGKNAPFWPGYTGAAQDGVTTIGVDENGALVARAAVLTDEGTFRCNFANSSLAISLGAVTVSGRTVTGSGFLDADFHYKDYFKLSADGEGNWTQVESIDSDTQATLVDAYPGGASGTGERALMKPFTGAGGSVAVASGQLTIGGGTTISTVTGVKRFTDYGPLVFRARVSISQRIANQEVHIGLEEDAAVPRWFARFLADGTTNTTIKCETGRNPSDAPSASEIESTTITLPSGLTTATVADYRVELLTESVRFFVNDVRVAEHVRVLPHQHDEMTSHVEIRNGGSAPASNTSVVVDYITGKNHNKLEIGVMSDSEKILAAAPPMDLRTFTQAGVIAVNTILMTVDCSQARSISIHSVSMGTAGVVTPEWSNDGTNWIAATLRDPAGAASTTFNAGSLLRTVTVQARYFRLRLSTATTAGTTTIVASTWQTDVSVPPTTQAVSGTVTANIGTGSLAAGTNAIGDVGLQVRANATGAASTSHVVSAATTNAANVKASAGRLLGWSAVNTTGVFQYVKLHNTAGTPTAGAGVVQTIAIPPNSVNNCPPTLPGIAFTTGIGRSIVTGSADTDATATTAGSVVLDLFFA